MVSKRRTNFHIQFYVKFSGYFLPRNNESRAKAQAIIFPKKMERGIIIRLERGSSINKNIYFATFRSDSTPEKAINHGAQYCVIVRG